MKLQPDVKILHEFPRTMLWTGEGLNTPWAYAAYGLVQAHMVTGEMTQLEALWLLPEG